MVLYTRSFILRQLLRRLFCRFVINLAVLCLSQKLIQRIHRTQNIPHVMLDQIVIIEKSMLYLIILEIMFGEQPSISCRCSYVDSW